MRRLISVILSVSLVWQTLALRPVEVSADMPLLTPIGGDIEFSEEGFPIVHDFELQPEELPEELAAALEAAQGSEAEENKATENKAAKSKAAKSEALENKAQSEPPDAEALAVEAAVVGEGTSLPATYPPAGAFRAGIRSQSGTQSCWAYAAMTAAEMSVQTNDTDYAEKLVVYGAFHGPEDSYLSDDYRQAHGNYYYAISALSNHFGYGDDRIYPYNTKDLTTAEMTDDVAHLRAAHILTDWPVKSAYDDEESWALAYAYVNAAVKQAVMDYGAVTASIQTSAYDAANSAYANAWPDSGKRVSPNHNITIIGWDDEKDVDGDGAADGAFYIQNSYGTSRGEGGYEWVVYGDASLCNPCAYEVETANAKGELRSNRVFSHTTAGYDGDGYSENAQSGALVAVNLFTAEEDCTLTQLGFYLCQAGSYELSLYQDAAAGDPNSGQLVETQSGSFDDAGFYCLDLEAPMALAAGDVFAVRCKQMRADGKTMICAEGTSEADVRQTSCAEGTSFLGLQDGARFYDCSTLSQYNNLCIYAYAYVPEPEIDVEVISGKFYQIIPKSATKLALACESAKYSAKIKTAAKKSSAEAQQFRFVQNKDGSWSLMSWQSELYLDAARGSTKNNANLQIYREDQSKSEKWTLVKNTDDGTVSFKNAKTGRAFALANNATKVGTQIVLSNYSGSDAQRFYIEEIKVSSHPYSGTYTIRAAKNKNFALDIANASRENGANLQLYKYKGNGAQKFRLYYSGDGYYRIENTRSTLVLDVKNGKADNGTNVQQWIWKANKAQRWKPIKLSNGKIVFVSELGTALDLLNGKAQNKQNIQTYRRKNNTAQQWVLVKV